MSEPTSTTAPSVTEAPGTNRVTMSPDAVSTSEARATCEGQESSQASSSTVRTDRPANSPEEEGLIKEMKNFDNLLKMMSVYRDNPDLRGNPNDRNIEEIAKVLSNFIGDDPDGFLRDEEDEETSPSDEEEEEKDDDDNQVTSNGGADQQDEQKSS